MGDRHLGRPPVRLAFVFYGATAAVAVGWGALAGRPQLFWAPGTPAARLIVGALAGLALGLAVVGLSCLALVRFAWARELYVWFGSLLGPLTVAQCLALAALSAVGEELLFRGAMQPTLGLVLTTLIFGLAHLPPRRRYLPWTIAAAGLGLAFGLLAQHGGSLAGPIVAHFVVNALNLMQVACVEAAPRGTGCAENLPGAEVVPSIDPHETAHHAPGAPSGPPGGPDGPGAPRGDGDSAG